MKTARTPIRHGELLLLPITHADMEKAVARKDYIASHSETGHHHIIVGECSVVEREGADTLIELSEDAKIEHRKNHDKHDTLDVPKGIYRALKKMEYDPFSRVMREVCD